MFECCRWNDERLTKKGGRRTKRDSKIRNQVLTNTFYTHTYTQKHKHKYGKPFWAIMGCQVQSDLGRLR
jgi:hypothetical protein